MAPKLCLYKIWSKFFWTQRINFPLKINRFTEQGVIQFFETFFSCFLQGNKAAAPHCLWNHLLNNTVFWVPVDGAVARLALLVTVSPNTLSSFTWFLLLSFSSFFLFRVLSLLTWGAPPPLLLATLGAGSELTPLEKGGGGPFPLPSNPLLASILTGHDPHSDSKLVWRQDHESGSHFDSLLRLPGATTTSAPVFLTRKEPTCR